MGSLRKELEQVREDSLLDALTGISNRKAFDSGLETTISESREQGSVFCLLLIDIDHFKQFNDTHGHLVGDKVLRFVAATLKRCIKGKDLCARYGGEEFAIILPDTDLAGAHTIAEQIRVAISGRVLKDSASGQAYGRITVSIGAGQYCDGELPNDTIGRADQALYQAKARGRNRVVVAES
nr:GGDEF domain-containing protein [Pseudomaricurvus alcaniphilus]